MWRSMYRSTSRGKSAPANAVILAPLPTNTSRGPCAAEYTITLDRTDRGLEPGVGIGDDQLGAGQAAGLQ